MWFVGLDVHWTLTTMCILDENGKKVKARTIRGPLWHIPGVVRQAADGHKFVIVYEASTSYGWLHDKLAEMAEKVIVAHPGQVRLIFCSKRKSDRIDASKLAKLLYLDAVPTVHVPGQDVRAWRGMIEHRRRVVDKRTRAKNALRALLRTHVIETPRSLWSRKGLAWLEEVSLPSPSDNLRRDMLLADVRHFSRQIKTVEKELNRIARRHPGVVLLRTIPGIGPRTAEAVMAYVDNPKRFRRNKCIGTYFGLVPCEDSSNKQRFGHITREGPPTVRKLMTEATWQAIRRDPTVHGYFERIRRGDPDRRKIALVATARYLLRVMLAMLTSGEAWRQAA